MRIAIIGTNDVAVSTAKILIAREHDVIIIDKDKEKLDELADQLDCSFLHGDGSRPGILEEVGPKETDVLFCLMEQDQDNLIAALVGRSLGFDRVVPSISDPSLEQISTELQLEDTIIPSQTISRYLADMLNGVDILELSTVIKGEARFFMLTAGKEDAGSIADIELPDSAKVICYYRDGEFMLADGDNTLKKGDEVVILTHSRNLPDLKERWQPQQANHDSAKQDKDEKDEDEDSREN